jgi:hypothetical protein
VPSSLQLGHLPKGKAAVCPHSEQQCSVVRRLAFVETLLILFQLQDLMSLGMLRWLARQGVITACADSTAGRASIHRSVRCAKKGIDIIILLLTGQKMD